MTVLLKPDSAEPGPMYICHGAENDRCHTLKIAADPDSAWLSGKVSLNFAPGEPPGITAGPQIGELLPFDPEGAEWELHCPAGGADREFECWVQSEYTSTPSRILMNLGHNRRVLVDSRAPIKAPVAGDNVTAAVTVASYYTKEHLEGVDVEWSVNGKHIMTIPADSGGVSTFSHRVSLQDINITATFQSPYDGVPIEKEFEMTVYEKSPWTEAILTVNGKLINWNDGIVLLRGKSNQFTVEVKPEIAQSLQLELVEDGGLSVAASPAFGTWNDPDGKEYSWEITPETTKSGHITMVLLSPQVTAHWELPCRVLSADLADEVAKIQVNGNDLSPAGVLFFRNEPMTITVVPKDGSPLAGHSLELKAIPLTGLSDANLTVTAKDVLTWQVNAHTSSGTFNFELKAAEVPAGINSPVCKVMSRYLDSEVDKIKVDGVDMPATGVTFFRNEPKTVTITYKQHSPLQGHPLQLAAIEPSAGMAGNVVVTSAGAHTWKVNAHTNSGTFKLELTGADMHRSVKTAGCKVISRNLSDEVEEIKLPVGTGDPSTRLTLMRGVAQTVTVVLKKNSPVTHDALYLAATPRTGLQPADLRVTNPGGLTWTLIASTRSGTFDLDLTGQDMTNGMSVPGCKVLSRNLADEGDILIKGVILPPTGTDFRVGISVPVILSPKASSPLAGHPIRLKRRLIEGLGPQDLQSTPDFDEDRKTLLYLWEVKGVSGNGTFQLSLEGAGMTSALTAPVCRLVGPVSDYFNIHVDGKQLAQGEKMLLTRYGLHTITFIPKNGSSTPKLKTSWGSTPPAGVEMLPAAGVPQTVDPVKGASWEIRCLDGDGEFSLKAAFEGTDAVAMEIPMSLAAGSYKLHLYHIIPLPHPPALVPVWAGQVITPRIRVVTLADVPDVPVGGIRVQFIAPGFPDGFGTSDSTGYASSSQVIKYEALGVYEIIAKTTEATGRASMTRCLIQVKDKPA